MTRFKPLACAVFLTVVSASVFLPGYSQDLQSAFDELVAGAQGKVAMDPLIGKVASFGSAAVPLLTARYREVDPHSRWAVAAVLCAIASADARRFVRGLLKEGDQDVVVHVLRRYPTDYEDEILDPLVQLLFADVRSAYDAKRRLKPMIVRKPSRAGNLLGYLKDTPDAESNNQRIFEVLESVSGYASSWGTDMPIGADRIRYRNDYWRDWWKKSKDKQVFEWLIDTYNSNPEFEGRQTEAIQVLAWLSDPRAVECQLKALDSKFIPVRYYAIIGLKKLEGTFTGDFAYPKNPADLDDEIRRLKAVFSPR